MCQDAIQGFQHRSVRRCKNIDTRTERKKGVQTCNRYDLLNKSTLGTRIGFSCLLVLHREVFQLGRREVHSRFDSPELDIFTLIADRSSVLTTIEQCRGTSEK